MNKNVIIVLLDYNKIPSWYTKIIEPTIKKYAEHCKADYITIGPEISKWDPAYKPPRRFGGRLFHRAWYRLLLWGYFIKKLTYDKVLFLDCDEYILNYDYNIFDQCDNNIICTSCKWLVDYNDKKTHPYITNYARLNKNLILEKKLKKLKYQINGGIHVLDRESAKKLYESVFVNIDPVLADCGVSKPYNAYEYTKGPGEQPYFTYKFIETGLCKLTDPWIHTTPENVKSETVFAHFVGPTRKKWIYNYTPYKHYSDNYILEEFNISEQYLNKLRDNIIKTPYNENFNNV